jgi:hypothetical protein
MWVDEYVRSVSRGAVTMVEIVRVDGGAGIGGHNPARGLDGRPCGAGYIGSPQLAVTERADFSPVLQVAARDRRKGACGYCLGLERLKRSARGQRRRDDTRHVFLQADCAGGSVRKQQAK